MMKNVVRQTITLFISSARCQVRIFSACVSKNVHILQWNSESRSCDVFISFPLQLFSLQTKILLWKAFLCPLDDFFYCPEKDGHVYLGRKCWIIAGNACIMVKISLPWYGKTFDKLGQVFVKRLFKWEKNVTLWIEWLCFGMNDKTLIFV